MSAGAPTLIVPPRFERARPARHRESSTWGGTAIRLAGFLALGLYGVLRWTRLSSPAPTLRLLGLLALAFGLVLGVSLLRRIGNPPAVVLAGVLCLVSLPVAGLPWHLFAALKVAASARYIGDGLAGLPGAIVPYAGASHPVSTVITLGAAVLLLDAAIVLAFAPPALGDLRRAGAALPLLALAVVPATLVRPELPYAQGLILFGLLAAFLWGERVRRERAGAAIAVAVLAGLGAAVAAPRIDGHRAWFDYRTWAGTPARARLDSFVWNQTYGPLHWPRRGHVVLSVTARTPDYWKAENLDVFNGRAWVAENVTAAQLPGPDSWALNAWSQTIRVRIGNIATREVIAAGYASDPLAVPGGSQAGLSEGTWVTPRPLAPGTTYVINTYSPRPDPHQLATAGRAYPPILLDDYRTVAIPVTGSRPPTQPLVIFPRFGTHSPGVIEVPAGGRTATSIASTLAGSPYAGVYRLARRLAAHARTPYAVVTHIERFLLANYSYNERPPAAAYPLVSFLLATKLGYCQHFSGAMALLLRMDGIPARISTGFTTGTRQQGQGGAFVVSDIDAHAWVEVWFPHYGWVRFDPTPSLDPALGGRAALPVVKNLPGASGVLPTVARRQPSAGTTRASRRGRALAGGVTPLDVVLLAGALALGAWLLTGWRAGGSGVEARLREFERALARTGRPLAPAVTLADLEHRFRDRPEAAAYLRGLRLERYRDGVAGEPVRGARRALRAQLRQGLGLRGRLRALWALPPRPPRRPGRPARSLKS